MDAWTNLPATFIFFLPPLSLLGSRDIFGAKSDISFESAPSMGADTLGLANKQCSPASEPSADRISASEPWKIAKPKTADEISVPSFVPETQSPHFYRGGPESCNRFPQHKANTLHGPPMRTLNLKP